MKIEIPDDSFALITIVRRVQTVNALQGFLDARCIVDQYQRTLFRDLYDAYADYRGVRSHRDKHRFRQDLLASGFTIRAGTGNRRYAHGLRIQDASILEGTRGTGESENQ